MSEILPPKDILNGLWAFNGQHEVLDDDLARTKLGLKGDQPVPWHGNYTRQAYHYVVLRSGTPKSDAAAKPITNFILEIFDEKGNFGHAEWNGDLKWGKGGDEIGAWEFSYDVITVEVPAGNLHLPQGDKLVLTPSLVLTPGASVKKDTRFPRNGADDTTP